MLNPSGREEPVFSNASAYTIEALLNRLTVPINDESVDYFRRMEKLSESVQELRVIHYRAIDRSAILGETFAQTHRLTLKPSCPVHIEVSTTNTCSRIFPRCVDGSIIDSGLRSPFNACSILPPLRVPAPVMN